MFRIFAALRRELSISENFRNDWYGWATNQMAHILLGFIFAGVVSFCLFSVIGEFAHKEATWAIVALPYLVFETRKPSFDAIEDWIFVCIYGAGAAIMLFDETVPGSPLITTNIKHAPIFGGIVAAHLLVGIAARIERSKE